MQISFARPLSFEYRKIFGGNLATAENFFFIKLILNFLLLFMPTEQSVWN